MKKLFQNFFWTVFVIYMFIFYCPFRLFSKDDIQYWHSQSISKQLDNKWSAKLRLDYRFNQNVDQLFMQFTDYEVNYYYKPFLYLSANYRQVYQKSDFFHLGHRPHLNATLICRRNPFTLKNRLRLECRLRESNETVWRYRNKIGVDVKMKIIDISCRPYIEDEIFINGQSGEREKNWLIGGLKIPVMKHYQFDVYMMLQSIKKAVKWENDYIICTSICYLI
ncbi:DUF2490 domain-containing protein [candidate division KSB1 bacterium]|nr:DUF2490 domain-containing protein [candidate division KSB1 bacterium]